jgi:NifU-like protein involved in Fe-S cluster formation
MDKAVIQIYRRLLRTGFEHSGSLENPSIFLDSIGEKIRICDQSSRDYLNIYINVDGGVIDDIKYLCTCDPTANVVIETLCSLVKGKTLEEAKKITKESFYQAIGSSGETLVKKVDGIIQLLNRGIERYMSGVA